MNNNAGKTGLLISEDHPYFRLNDLDREKIYKQVEKLHFGITKKNALSTIKTGSVGELPDGRLLQIIHNSHIVHILGKSHKNRPTRNNILVSLKNLLGEAIKQKHAEDEGKHSSWAVHWYYYKLTINAVDYFLNVYESLEGEFALFSITDLIKK